MEVICASVHRGKISGNHSSQLTLSLIFPVHMEHGIKNNLYTTPLQIIILSIISYSKRNGYDYQAYEIGS